MESHCLIHCKNTARSFGDAFNMLNKNCQIVKIPNQNLKSVIVPHKNGGASFLATFVTNFRTIDGQPIGHLETLQGKIPIPKYFPTNPIIHGKYGIPQYKGEDLIVNAYLLLPESKYYGDKSLPMYNEWL